MKCVKRRVSDFVIEELDDYMVRGVCEYSTDISEDEVFGLFFDGEALSPDTVLHFRNLQFLSARNVVYTFSQLFNNSLRVIEAVNCHLSCLIANCFIELEILNLESNCISSLDVSKCTKLKYLNVENNVLRTLDVSCLVALEQLICAANELLYLDVKENKHLSLICCGDNFLCDLEVGQMVTYLECSRNLLQNIHVEDCSKLVYLSAYSNHLTNITFNRSIRYLDVSFNEISELNTRKMPNLTSLYIAGNEISYISVRMCTELEELYVESTKNNGESPHKQLKAAIELGGFRGKTDYFDFYDEEPPKMPRAVVELLELRDMISDDIYRLQKYEIRHRNILRQIDKLLE